MFNLFRRNCLYSESIEPHCAYCAHCKPDNEYQGVCAYRGIVAMAGSCRRFEYDALRRKPPKPARIRGRFTDADFFFEEKEIETSAVPNISEASPAHKPLISHDFSEFADLWEDDEDAPAAAAKTNESSQPIVDKPNDITNTSEQPDTPQEERCDEV